MARERTVTGASDVNIEFTVKELLARIEGKLDTLTALTHEKADKAELLRLETWLHKIEKETIKRPEFDNLDKKNEQLEKDAMIKKEAKEILDRLAVVERDMVSSQAVQEVRTTAEQNHSRIKWVITGCVISLLGLVVGSIFLVLNYLKTAVPVH
jgi:DNA repair ATPase RecN